MHNKNEIKQTNSERNLRKRNKNQGNFLTVFNKNFNFL